MKLEFFISTDSNATVIQDSSPNFTFRIVDRLDDLKPYLDLRMPFIPLYHTRISLGHLCAAAVIEGRLAHLCWIARNKIHIDEVHWTMELPKDLCCIYDAKTEPDFRQKGIYTRMIREIRRWWSASGGNKTVIYSDSRNTPSLRGILSAGQIPAGSIIAYLFMNRIIMKRLEFFRNGMDAWTG